jgi:nucleoside-diphosphate-sugar epimerase
MFAAYRSFTDDVRAGKVPVAGAGNSVFSFIHVRRVAAAVVAALDHVVPGVFNIVDDYPTAIPDWLSEAEVLCAPPPKRLPRALVRLAAGAWRAAYLGRLRGADNARAWRVLDWQPQYRRGGPALAHELTARVEVS